MDASYQNGLTALAGGGQTGATPISRTFSRFTTVATTGDSAMLPTASAGLCYTVKNAGANSMNVFPNTTAAIGVVGSADQINAFGGNTAFAVASNKAAQFFCVVNGFWDVILSA